MTDPIAAAGAVLMGANALANVVQTALNVSVQLSPIAKHQHYTCTGFKDCGTPDEVGIESDAGPITLKRQLAGARSFDTDITYETHCRVFGRRAVRQKIVLRLAGSIVRYVVADPSDDASDRSSRVGDIGEIYGFHNLRMTLGVPTGEVKQNPFNKFNDSVVLSFEPEVPDDAPTRVRVNWKFSSGGFAFGGFPVALTKARNGFFELSVDGELTSGDEYTGAHFRFDQKKMPGIPDLVPEDAERGAGDEPPDAAADRPMISRSRPPRSGGAVASLTGRFRKGAHYRTSGKHKATGDPEVGTST